MLAATKLSNPVEWPVHRQVVPRHGKAERMSTGLSVALASLATWKGRSSRMLRRAQEHLRVLLVIHGYPPLYNAGSEVYTQTLARELKRRGHEVLVFCREEDTIAPYFRIRDATDGDDGPAMKIINLPNLRDRYIVKEVDEAVESIVTAFEPDVVHCGHLNHLSISLVDKVTAQNVPFIYTLHDFWMNCPRGQFIQFTGEDAADLWPLCDGQEDQKCAKKCYVPRIGSGHADSFDEEYWTRWIGRRMADMKQVAEKVDLFIAPAQHLLERFIQDGRVDLSPFLLLFRLCPGRQDAVPRLRLRPAALGRPEAPGAGLHLRIHRDSQGRATHGACGLLPGIERRPAAHRSLFGGARHHAGRPRGAESTCASVRPRPQDLRPHVGPEHGRWGLRS